MNKASWPLWGFVVLVVLFSAGLWLNPTKITSPLIGQTHPTLVGVQLENNKPFDAAQLEHQAWLLNVWASWCVGCRQEHPQLITLSQQPGLVLVGLNYKDDRDEAQSWLQKYQNPFDYMVQDLDGVIGLDWGVIAVPETFLINAQGRVQAKWSGALTDDMIEQQVLPAWRQAQKTVEP